MWIIGSLLLSLAFAETDESVCLAFAREVLQPALVTDYEDESDPNPSRFVKDEKQAAQLLQKFDPTKLNIKLNSDEIKKTAVFCDDEPKKDAPVPITFCSNMPDAKRFFDGFAYGYKKNEWNAELRSYGIKKFRLYAKEILNGQVSPDDYALLLANLQLMFGYGMLKKNFTRDLDEMRVMLDEGRRKMAPLAPVPGKAMPCSAWLVYRHEQEVLMKRLRSRMEEIMP